jgi:sugar phosphate isomerase/epimerase
MYTLFDASDAFYRVKKSVQELSPLVRKHGIQGINPPAVLLEDSKKAREAAKCVYDNGLKWGLLPTPVDFFVPDTTDQMFDEGLEKLKIWARVGEKIGVKYAYNHVFPGHNEREYDENFEWHIIRAKQINSIMADHGIYYGLEFIGSPDLRNHFKYPFIHTVSGIFAIADTIDPRLGIVFDTFHWYVSTNDLDDLYYTAMHADRIVCFHINDGIAGKSREKQLDLTRALPMTTGVIDSARPYKLLCDNGYVGPVLCEPINPAYRRYAEMEAEDVVIEIAKSYKKMEEFAAMYEPARTKNPERI